MEKHIVYSGRAVISYRWLVSPEGQLSLEKVKERDVGIMSTPFVNTLFFCVLLWLDVSVTRCRSVFGFVLMSSAVKFALSQTSQCTRIMQCISVTVIRSLVVSTNCCKTNPCAGSVHHLWAHAVQLSNSFSLQRQCLECSATQLLLPMHGRTACSWCLREWWQQHLLKMS